MSRTTVRHWSLSHIALQLLLEAKLDNVNRVEVWNWIQHAKARSLAGTVDLKSVIPDTLMRCID